MTDRKAKKRGPAEAEGKQPSESSPNPHGENKILQMPIRTDQRRDTRGQNVAQVPNLMGGRLNPSVAHEVRSIGGGSKSNPAQGERPRTQKPGNRDPFQSDSKEQKRKTPSNRT
ncbi:MAG: hypothetical protein WA738_20295 [Candidatus Angelobacter sp.]